jgi:hypothetical protein
MALPCGGIHLIKIRRADETLDQRDVRTVRGVQREAFREHPAQTGIHGFRVLDHRGVRLQADVNGRYVGVGFMFRTGYTTSQYCHGGGGSHRTNQEDSARDFHNLFPLVFVV